MMRYSFAAPLSQSREIGQRDMNLGLSFIARPVTRVLRSDTIVNYDKFTSASSNFALLVAHRSSCEAMWHQYQNLKDRAATCAKDDGPINGWLATLRSLPLEIAE